MLEIARAMLLDPRVLLIDEPSVGLSPIFVQQVFGLLRIFRDRGTTVLMIEQNANRRSRSSDRGLVLQQGRLALSGTASEVLNHPEIGRLFLGGAMRGRPDRPDRSRPETHRVRHDGSRLARHRPGWAHPDGNHHPGVHDHRQSGRAGGGPAPVQWAVRDAGAGCRARLVRSGRRGSRPVFLRCDATDRQLSRWVLTIPHKQEERIRRMDELTSRSSAVGAVNAVK